MNISPRLGAVCSSNFAPPPADVPTITNPGPTDTPPPGDTLNASTDTFTFSTGGTVTNTSWKLRLTSSNAIIWSSLHDTVHKFTITIPANTMNATTQYTLQVQFFGQRLTSRRASVTFTSGT